MNVFSKLIKYFTEKQEGWFLEIVFMTVGFIPYVCNDRNSTIVSVNNININGNVTINYCNK